MHLYYLQHLIQRAPSFEHNLVNYVEQMKSVHPNDWLNYHVRSAE